VLNLQKKLDTTWFDKIKKRPPLHFLRSQIIKTPHEIVKTFEQKFQKDWWERGCRLPPPPILNWNRFNYKFVLFIIKLGRI
jgi:hypothetical protein